MVEGLDADVVGEEAAVRTRDELLEEVTAHADRVAWQLSLLQGGDYGDETFTTEGGTWTLKYEGGAVQYLRFRDGGEETYVVSTKRPPEPEALAAALADYGNFVAAFNEYVADLEGVLDGVETAFPDVASTEDIAARRDEILTTVREYADTMAGELHRVGGADYGTFETRVDGTPWELKWEEGRCQYLRVGGEGGIYLLSQYSPPAARDLRAHVDDVAGFVEAYNEHVAAVSESLRTIDA